MVHEISTVHFLHHCHQRHHHLRLYPLMLIIRSLMLPCFLGIWVATMDMVLLSTNHVAELLPLGSFLRRRGSSLSAEISGMLPLKLTCSLGSPSRFSDISGIFPYWIYIRELWYVCTSLFSYFFWILQLMYHFLFNYVFEVFYEIDWQKQKGKTVIQFRIPSWLYLKSDCFMGE